MQIVQTDAAPLPGGHYSQALVHAGVVYVSGLLPMEPVSGIKVSGEIEEEADRVLSNLEAILTAAGSSRDRVLRCTVYISDLELWGRFNAVYASFFGEHRPARTVVPVPGLHYGFKVELDAIAAVS